MFHLIKYPKQRTIELEDKTTVTITNKDVLTYDGVTVAPGEEKYFEESDAVYLAKNYEFLTLERTTVATREEADKLNNPTTPTEDTTTPAATVATDTPTETLDATVTPPPVRRRRRITP